MRSKAYAQEVGTRYSVNGKGKAHRPFGLRMTQLIYHSGKLSTQASGLIDISPNTKNLSMGPEDLKNIGIASGERIRLTSDQGTLEMAVEENTSLMPGTCTVSEHFNEPPVKDLMARQVDAITGVPYFKLTHVTVEKA